MSSRRNSIFVLAALLAVPAAAIARGGAPGACAEWRTRAASLPAAGRAELECYGALDDGTWLLLGEGVVPDCDLRAAFSRYAGNVVRGVEPSPSDAALVGRHQEAFVKSLIAVWPTKEREVPGADGAFREGLSSLLVRTDVDVSAIRPLLGKIIRDDGVSGEVAYALLTRPDAALRAQVAGCGASPGHPSSRIYATAILQRLGDDVSAGLRELAAREDLTATQREVVAVLAARLRANEPPSWDDVIDLETE